VIPLDTLRAMPLFADLSEERTQWLCASLAEVRLRRGEVLVAEGEPSKGFFVLLEGEMLVSKRSSGHDMALGRHHPPSFFGEIQLLDGNPVHVTLTAVTDSRLLHLDDGAFRELLATSPAFSRQIFQAMTKRLTGLESFVRQREKMASLGTLAAGLAHELNNPAAAVARAADRMGTTLEELHGLTCALHEVALPPDATAALQELRHEAVGYGRAAGADGDPLGESEREDALADWLEERGVAEGWRIAPTLAAAGFTPERLNALAERLDATHLDPALRWLAATIEIAALRDEAAQGAARISELVRAMKSYSYMDQAPRQEVDIHDGIEDTLTIMKHRLKYGVTIVRDYDRALPRVTVFGSELNQVWTNLIDNAVDAMGGEGTLTVRTRRIRDRAVVEIGDTGPGVPPEIQGRVFEPFFTTKGVGRGTGLGLDISWRIIVNRHGGNIRLESEPGDTRFIVSLPLAPAT
jgi:signal transduction histidine kinase